MGFWEKIERTIIADPDGSYFARKAILKIDKLFREKDYQSVLEKSSEFIKLYPNFYSGYYYKGFVFLRQKKHSEAFENFSKCLELNPNINSIHYLCGYEQIELKNYQIALSYFERALDIFPNDTDLIGAKGLALLYLDEVEEANLAFKKAYEIDKSDGLNNTILYFFVRNRFEENLIYINKAKALDYNLRGKLILNYLEAMNSCMLGKDYLINVEIVNKLSKKIKAFGWEFIWIDKWLKEETVDETKRKFIVEINDYLKKIKAKLEQF